MSSFDLERRAAELIGLHRHDFGTLEAAEQLAREYADARAESIASMRCRTL